MFLLRTTTAEGTGSIEHLNALANGVNGAANSEDNCVVCCKQLNSLLGSKSIKAKLLVVLNQRGAFTCPGGADGPTDASLAPVQVNAPTANALVTKPKAKQLRFVFTLADTLPPKKTVAFKAPAPVAKTSMSPQSGAPAIKEASVARRPKTPAAASSTDERFNLVVTNLKQRGASRPRTLKTLTSTVSALFPQGLAEAELASLVQRLQSTGKVTLSENKVLYTL